MSGFTKEIIAKTFTELLDEKPMSKITVKDIVERCGVNRNTFYYQSLYSGMYGRNGRSGEK